MLAIPFRSHIIRMGESVPDDGVSRRESGRLGAAVDEAAEAAHSGRRIAASGDALAPRGPVTVRPWSGRRGSNPRHSAWKADALPTELLPHDPAEPHHTGAPRTSIASQN